MLVEYLEMVKRMAGSQSVVMYADSQSGGPQLEFYGWPFFDSCFIKFVIRISRDMKF